MYLAPRYIVRIEGTELKEDITQFISSVEYHESENVASKIVLNVINKDFRFLDDKIFAEGNKIDLWMGYVDDKLHFMNRGIIVKPIPTFPRSGIPILKVIAHDFSRKLMNTGKDDKGKVYKKLRDSEIAEKIFKEIEASPFTFQTKKQNTRIRKRGVTRWNFLQNLAKLNNYIVYVRYDEKLKQNIGYFGPPDVQDQPVKYKFSYGTGEQDATLFDFYPQPSIPSQTTKLKVVYTDPKSRKTHELTIETDKTKAEKTKYVGIDGKDKIKKEIKNGSAVTLTVFGQSQELIADRVFKSPADAKRFASSWFARRESDFIHGNGNLLGIFNVRMGHIHELKGLGIRYSGDWLFNSIIHTISKSGLSNTSFTAKKVVLDSVVGKIGNILSKVKNKEVDQ